MEPVVVGAVVWLGVSILVGVALGVWFRWLREHNDYERLERLSSSRSSRGSKRRANSIPSKNR